MMNRTIFPTLAAIVLGAVIGAGSATAGVTGDYAVTGVEAEDMLKMRAGPGVGYRIIVGLPNGTVVRVWDCEPSGGTRWCKVSLKQFRGVKGYVSGAYLKKM